MDDLGFDARIWRLEQLLVDLPSKDSLNNESMYENEGLSERISKLQNELESVLVDDKALRDFVDKYEKHENVLNPMASPFAVEQELLDITTKKELVLAAGEELVAFANQLKQIKALEHVLESSDISAVDELAIKLRPLEAKHKLQSQALSQTSKNLSQLMENYNGTVNTLSEIFINWDQMLSTLETHVTLAERGKT
ncbi:hypothetical protein INT44_005533 [Umbelopsis vinacea]|uniref:Dynactin subunit 3 n=1 Tax=Umbelopsis vinacea TaxID=44442 RepID=A0A8H7U8K3_9FUNG|nr:hypothetical protein INT44_005533 [Umbelopsis vinacea]